ncbi:hypothetical protein D3C78_746490 [compost metagenome]
MLHRREQRRAGADDDVGLAVPGCQPGIQAFAVVHRRMQQRDAGVEALLEAGQGLRAEVDLRDQHQGLLAGFQCFADQLQVHLGLAAAGDTGQQEGAEAAKAFAHGVEGVALLFVERQFRLCQPVFVAQRRQVAADLDLHQVLGQQQVEAVLVQVELGQQAVGHAVRVLGQGLEGIALAWCAGDARVFQAGAGGDVPEALLAHLGGFALAQQGRQGPAQGVTQAVLVVLGGPQAQLEQRRRDRRHRVEQGAGRLELVGGHFALLAHLHQHADHFAAAEWHANAHAWGQGLARHACRRLVVEQATQRGGQGKAQDDVGHAESLGGRFKDWRA